MKKILIIFTFIFSFFGGSFHYFCHQRKTTEKGKTILFLKNEKSEFLKEEKQKTTKIPIKKEKNLLQFLFQITTLFIFIPFLLTVIYCVLVIKKK